MKNAFALITSALMWLAGPSLADDIPVYDPNYIPMDLRLTRIDACKVSVPVDPVWPGKAIRKTNASGQPVRGMEYNVDSAFWDRQPDRAQQYVVNPLLTVSVSCSPTTLTETGSFDGLAFFAESYHGSVKKRTGNSPRKLETFQAPGLGTVYAIYEEYETRDTDRAGATRQSANFYALHRGKLLWVRVTASGKPPGIYNKRQRKGYKVRITEENGETFVFRLGSPAMQHLLSAAIAARRTPKQNAALFKTFAQSLKGY